MQPKQSKLLFFEKLFLTIQAVSLVRQESPLKKWFSLNPGRQFRIYPFEKMVAKYGTAEELIKAAGRTSKYYNQIGAYGAAGGAATLSTTEDCECE